MANKLSDTQKRALLELEKQPQQIFGQGNSYTLNTMYSLLKRGLITCVTAGAFHADSIFGLTELGITVVMCMSEPKSAPAKSASARLVVRESAMASVGRKKAAKSSATGKPVSIAITADKQPVLQPVSFGGSLDTELGLAESLNLLNSLQLASGGAWLEAQYETPEGI